MGQGGQRTGRGNHEVEVDVPVLGIVIVSPGWTGSEGD